MRPIDPRGVLAVTLVTLVSFGCASADLVVEPYPTGAIAGPARDSVPVYKEGFSAPPGGGVPLVKIDAHGNRHADAEYLEQRIAERAGELGADYAIVAATKVNDEGAVLLYTGDPYSGIATARPVRTLSVEATGYVRLPVRLGYVVDEDLIVIDVVPGLPMHAAGLRIGDRLLAIGGQRLGGDAQRHFRALTSLVAGQPVELEVAGGDNQSRVLTVVPLVD
jgi:C-terminal processing protease CtpA/Prc